MPHVLRPSLSDWFVQFFQTAPLQAVAYDYFADHEVAGYDAVMQGPGAALESDLDANLSTELNTQRIDDATWRDLDVRAYLKRVAVPAGLLARQVLYYRLRTGQPDDAFTAPLQTAIAHHHPETPALLAATEPTREVLRSISVDLTPALWGTEKLDIEPWTRWLWLAPVFALLGLMLPWSAWSAWSFLTPWLIGGYLLVNGWTQIRLSRSLNRWHALRDAVATLLHAAVQWGDAGRAGAARAHPVLQPLAQALAAHRKLMAQVSPSWVERMPMVAEYANLFALYQYARLHRNVARLQALLPGLRAAYVQLAKAEAQICLLEHLSQHSTVCVAQWVPLGTAEKPVPELDVQGLVNPLLDHAQTLNMHLRGQGALVTGQNGVGKSTWLRGLGLSLLTARAFGFCYATQARVPRLPVWSSIHNEDSLCAAQSLYMAEMRRAETLLRVAQSRSSAVFLIDEIFKGTNHTESVAAAAAVLSHLAAQSLVVVSTHNVVLAPLLIDQLQPLRLTADAQNNLALEPGVLVHTNGLRMMEHYAFPDSVRQAAARVHGWFSCYVAEPDAMPKLLLKK